MSKLSIRHRTSYIYSHPVRLGPQRLMLRPREACDVRLSAFRLSIEPEATVHWAHDIFGNAVATAVMKESSDRLLIESVSEIELRSSAWPVFEIAASAISYPFFYADDDWANLGALTTSSYPDPEQRLSTWARAFVAREPTDTLSLLKDLSAGVTSCISYQSRDAEGTQSPLATLDRGWGSCRDMAVLFVEAARCLGFGARIVSGYLHDPEEIMDGMAAGGSTHAWAEVYVPGAGWITFDPTNRSVGGYNLVPVAVARDIRHAMPVSGSFLGGHSSSEMSVEVCITPVEA